MALELNPAWEGASEDDGGELRDMTRRLLVCALLTLPVFITAMAP